MNSPNNDNGNREMDMKDVTVVIKTAKNGVTVKVCGDDMMDEETYVYSSLDEAMKEIPSVISVAKETEGKPKVVVKKMEGDY